MTVESLTTSESMQAHGERTVGFLSRAADEESVPSVVIRGVGLLTPLGETVEQIWDALLAGRYITDHTRAAGEFDRSSPRVIQMARRVADQALAHAGWKRGEDFATIVGTSKGSVESWLTPLQYMANSPYEAGGSGRAFPDVTGLADIAASLGGLGCGPKLTVSAACVSGLLAVIRGCLMIQSGEARRVLVVASEASVHPLFLGSFMRLGVLPKPEIGCRPFDETRDGFLMSEAAAAICLEAASETNYRGDSCSPVVPTSAQSPRPGIAIDRFAFGADATHLTGSDPAGRVMTYLINKVTRNVPVDLVHAHGTGTVANDPTELAAIESALAGTSSAPCLYSHKAALGHSLGAAGLIAVVLNVLAHERGVVPPNVRTTHPLPTDAVTISRGVQHRPIRRSLALAAGFGGATAALSLTSIYE
jgi:3-oxoacyl-[acyl-carrier-protein] synthase II